MLTIQLAPPTTTELLIVNSARVSLYKSSTSLSEADQNLIRFLYRQSHWTPFGHPQLTLMYDPPRGWNHPEGIGSERVGVERLLIERGSLWYWVNNYTKYGENAPGIANLVAKHAPTLAEVAGLPPHNSKLPSDVYEFDLTDEWVATRVHERAALATSTFLVRAPIPIRTQCFKHKYGFCVSGDTEVTFTEVVKGKAVGKRTKTMRELHTLFTQPQVDSIGRRVYTREQKNLRVLNTETGFFERGTAVDVVSMGVKPVFEITSASGKKLKLTRDHRLWTKEGWKPLDEAIGLEVTANGLATMSKTAYVGVNGRRYGGYDTYRDYSWMKAQRDAGLSVSEIANAAACSYDTVRAWLKVHQLQFDPLANLTGTNGQPPWNKGKFGYTTNYRMSDEIKAKLRESRSGERSNFWKGGISGDKSWRKEVALWATRQAKKCHQKHYFTCQQCGKKHKDLVAHHVIPAYANRELAYNFDNLITVCRSCHQHIHANQTNEQQFARGVLCSSDVKRDFTGTKKHTPSLGNTLRVHFEEIVSVVAAGEEEVFDLTTDHPSHNFVANGFIAHNCENEVSRRYVDAPPTFYEPEIWRSRAPGIKQGSLSTPVKHHRLAQTVAKIAYTVSDMAYRAQLLLGVCPEQARFLLAQGMETEWYWTASLADFHRAYRLRRAPDAQREIWELFGKINDLLTHRWPLSWRKLCAMK